MNYVHTLLLLTHKHIITEIARPRHMQQHKIFLSLPLHIDTSVSLPLKSMTGFYSLGGGGGGVGGRKKKFFPTKKREKIKKKKKQEGCLRGGGGGGGDLVESKKLFSHMKMAKS